MTFTTFSVNKKAAKEEIETPTANMTATFRLFRSMMNALCKMLSLEHTKKMIPNVGTIAIEPPALKSLDLMYISH